MPKHMTMADLASWLELMTNHDDIATRGPRVFREGGEGTRFDQAFALGRQAYLKKIKQSPYRFNVHLQEQFWKGYRWQRSYAPHRTTIAPKPVLFAQNQPTTPKNPMNHHPDCDSLNQNPDGISKPCNCSRPAYLGDSVYVAIERGMIKLTTDNGEGPTNTIFLEYPVYLALVAYVSQLESEAAAKAVTQPNP